MNIHSCSTRRYAYGIDLPDHVVEHPVIQALNQGTNDLVTWSNVSLSVFGVLLISVDGRRIYFLITSNNPAGILII